MILVFAGVSFKSFAQPRFLAYNVIQSSSVTVSSATLASQTAENARYTLTGIGVGNTSFMWFDCGLVANVVIKLLGKDIDAKPNADGYTAADMGLISFTLGKQYVTKDKYTIGVGVDCDIRAFGGMPKAIGPLVFTLGPAVCGQYRPNKIVTFVSLLGGGVSFGGRQTSPVDGFGILWRNFISVGYGVLGINLGPDFHFFNVKDMNEINWSVFTQTVQLGISLRLK